MPRGRNKKELPEPVLTNGLKDTNVVQKSKPLFSLWKSNLTLSEFKILDTYLSRINSNNPESRSVVFEKGELEKLLGVTKINRPELQKRLRHLQGTVVSVGEGKDIDEITLFERSQAIQDEDGLWQIKLTASLSAMKYIFNIEKIGYFRYKIRAITKLRSLYSYTMFMYLEYNKYKGKWTESLDELKKVLGCEAERYKEFKFFNSEILKKCQKEVMENTPLNFTYTPIKKCRKVVAVEFDIKKSQKIEIIDKNPEPKELPYMDEPQAPEQYIEYESPIPTGTNIQASYNQSEPKAKNTYSDDYHSFLADACNEEFTEKQIEDILSMISTMPWIQSDYRLAGIPHSFEFAYYHYIKEVYSRLNVYAETHKVDNRYALFRKFVDNDRKKGLEQYED